MNKKNVSKYSPEQRLMIIKEYESGTMTAAEVAKKYGLNGPNLISVWRRRLQNSPKNCTFVVENGTKVVNQKPMSEKTKAELEAELAKVKKELEWSKLQTKALETMIEIAEEHGIQIRKKSGAKQ
ncbi:MAG: transposase [Paludibacteraceae bacterium]|nr:transposase [Paludibacteraceae bacterium]